MHLVLCVAFYTIYLVIASFATRPVIKFVDDRFPNVFFYHMKPDELGGPLDGAHFILPMIVLAYTLFLCLFVPAALYAKISKPVITLIALVNLPVYFWFLFFFYLR